MQAIILAAGMGKRLKELTKHNTKCMVEICGVPLIDRMLAQLDRLHLEKIVLVVGYEKDSLMEHIASLPVKTPVIFVENPVYDRTNNIYSLFLAREYLSQDDTLLLESDLIFEDDVLAALLDDPRDTLALVDKYESWMDGTVIRVDGEDSILEFIPKEKFRYGELTSYYKTVNIYKFSRRFSQSHYLPFLEAYTAALGGNAYYEQVLRVITLLDDPGIKAKRLAGQKWYEIDDVQDLDIASSIFAPEDGEKVRRIQNRFGGYWRYPHMKDFCYLVNPYYPPKKLVEEMRSNFETLLTQYPSGMGVCSLLAAKNFGLRPEHIVVGNGAAELIGCLLSTFRGKLGVIRPTFEEYPNRYDMANQVVFTPENDDFSYTAEDLIDFFGGKEIKALILINPDNPSGNYIPKKEVMRLAEFCEKREITLLLDESFADFAEEEENSFLQEEILRRYPHLLVMKSISKSYGVPGVRLGVLASEDEGLIARMKKAVSIWNINSFGEFYLQIAEKYERDYRRGLQKLITARRRFGEALSALPGVRVIPSEANYLTVELTGISAGELTRRLFIEEQILIKDLSAKIKRAGRQFVRIAVRDEEDNACLVRALARILGENKG